MSMSMSVLLLVALAFLDLTIFCAAEKTAVLLYANQRNHIVPYLQLPLQLLSYAPSGFSFAKPMVLVSEVISLGFGSYDTSVS